MCGRDSCNFRNEIILIDGSCEVCPPGLTPDPLGHQNCMGVNVPSAGELLCSDQQIRSKSQISGAYTCEWCPPFTKAYDNHSWCKPD